MISTSTIRSGLNHPLYLAVYFPIPAVYFPIPLCFVNSPGQFWAMSLLLLSKFKLCKVETCGPGQCHLYLWLETSTCFLRRGLNRISGVLPRESCNNVSNYNTSVYYQPCTVDLTCIWCISHFCLRLSRDTMLTWANLCFNTVLIVSPINVAQFFKSKIFGKIR